MPPISRTPRGPPASTTRSASNVPRALSTTYRPPRSSTPSTSHISNRSTASSPSTAQVALRAATGGWTYPSSAVYVAPTKRAQFRSGKRRLPSSGSTHSFSTPADRRTSTSRRKPSFSPSSPQRSNTPSPENRSRGLTLPRAANTAPWTAYPASQPSRNLPVGGPRRPSGSSPHPRPNPAPTPRSPRNHDAPAGAPSPTPDYPHPLPPRRR